MLPIPQVAQDEAIALIVSAHARGGPHDPKILKKYRRDLEEAFSVAYVLARAETWEDLDQTKARALIDDGLGRVRQPHVETGEMAFVVSEPLHRVHFTLLGLLGQHPAFEEFRKYIDSREAYHRLTTLDEMQLEIGLGMVGVKDRHADRFVESQALAWRIGHALGVLDVLGEVGPRSARRGSSTGRAEQS